MKKSILMAIVALALLAAPAFAGDYSITGNIDLGWGFGLNATGSNAGGSAAADVAYNDFTMLGFNGSIDDFNSISVTMEYGNTGSGIYGGMDGSGNLMDGANQAYIGVTGFSLTTDILGSVGVTGVPVTLSMTNGFGRLELHNRYQQWTGFEILRWKETGAAHLENVWNRYPYLSLTIGIMDMVNLRFGMVPQFNEEIVNSEGDEVINTPILVEAWTSGIAAGPAALDIAASMRAQGEDLYGGLQVTANMNFGALGLVAFVGEDYHIDDASGNADNLVAIALKPSYNFGAGSVSLGAWYQMATALPDGGDSVTVHSVAVDVALSYATVTLYGGAKMTDLTEEVGDMTTSIDIGVKNAFGAATIGLGYFQSDAGGQGNDIGAADGTAINWTNEDGDDVGGLYFRVTAWY